MATDLKTITPGTAAASSVVVGATSAAAASPSLFTTTGSGNVVLSASPTLTGNTVVSSGSFGLSGNISSAAWTTSGIRYANVAATLTDTSSTGTVLRAYTDLFGGNTIASNNPGNTAITFTDYITGWFSAPTAGTNVTITNAWALGVGGNLKLGADASGTNQAGTNITIGGSRGTGTGAGGSIIFQVAPAGTTGTAQNALATALTIATTAITAQNHLLFSADNTYDIGASSTTLRPRNVYVAGAINAGGNISCSNSSEIRMGSRVYVGSNGNGYFYIADSAYNGVTLNFSTNNLLQIKNVANNAFASIQGKLTTDTAYTAGDPTTTGYLVIYDSNGTAYKVPALAV